MYTIVLATMLTTGAAAPDFGRGCHGCCGGCYGCCGGCYGCCGGCYGCCGGCYGCCGGCWGGCYGCCGGCYGCYGCGGGWYSSWGCYGSCYGCYGGCYGGIVVATPVTVAPAATVVPPTQVLPVQPKKDDNKKAALGNAAEVVLKVPANVELSVEDRVLPRSANEETFRTPELEPGSSYTYTFTARVVRDGRKVAYSKQVKVRAGQTSSADFTKLLTEGKDNASVTVKLPADARLYVDDVPCPLTSASRTFDTPALAAGQSYYYTLKAEVERGGEKYTDRKHVLVEAGKQVTVEFKDLMVQTASR